MYVLKMPIPQAGAYAAVYSVEVEEAEVEASEGSHVMAILTCLFP